MKVQNSIRKGNKLTTFSSTDAKLNRFLLWYERHKHELVKKQENEEDNKQEYQYLLLLLSQFRLLDSTKMKYSEKNALLKALIAAKKAWGVYRKLEDNQQHPITKFFKKSSKQEEQPPSISHQQYQHQHRTC